MYRITTWERGHRVEARHPTYHREWGMATVEEQFDAYVEVRFDDGLRRPASGRHLSDRTAYTHYLNVREPGTPDPVRLLGDSTIPENVVLGDN